jgi:CheY-like chemotaxis protein
MLSSTILVVDDNEDDVFALRRALKKANIANPQQVLTHGQAAIDYLSGTGEYADRSRFPLPFLMLLDLKMPFRGGFEVLEWAGQQPELSGLAIIILTGSDEIKDHQRAYALGARSYVVKPPSPQDLQQVMRSMDSLWLREHDKSPLIGGTSVPDLKAG